MFGIIVEKLISLAGLALIIFAAVYGLKHESEPHIEGLTAALVVIGIIIIYFGYSPR